MKMENDKLFLNLDAILKKVNALKPEEVKSKYIVRATLATNIGKGLRLDLSDYYL